MSQIQPVLQFRSQIEGKNAVGVATAGSSVEFHVVSKDAENIKTS